MNIPQKSENMVELPSDSTNLFLSIFSKPLINNTIYISMFIAASYSTAVEWVELSSDEQVKYTEYAVYVKLNFSHSL